MTPAGELTSRESAALADARRYHGLPAGTPLHECPPHIVDGIARMRVAQSLGERSPVELQRAFVLAKELMLAHSERLASRRYHRAKE